MCFRVNCNDCQRPTWAGCGAHIESALRGVPVEDRCCCREQRAAAAQAAAQAQRVAEGQADQAQEQEQE